MDVFTRTMEYMKQHPPNELPPLDPDDVNHSIAVLVKDDHGYVVARYDMVNEFWYVNDGYIPSKENSGVYDIEAWWILPDVHPCINISLPNAE